MAIDGYESPVAVDAPLEYITIASYAWPQPPPPKRARLDEKERRRRHCECQKRFLARKRLELDQLRQNATKLELQLKLLEAVVTTKALQKEHCELQVQSTLALHIGDRDEAWNLGSDAHDGKHIHGSADIVELLDVDEILAGLDHI